MLDAVKVLVQMAEFVRYATHTMRHELKFVDLHENCRAEQHASQVLRRLASKNKGPESREVKPAHTERHPSETPEPKIQGQNLRHWNRGHKIYGKVPKIDSVEDQKR
jgi:hypothetical protein